MKCPSGESRMKFGLEAEKFLFNLDTRLPSEGVFSFIDALSDFTGEKKVTNEFVLNMVEIGTTPSTSPVEVLKDYLLHYLMIKKIAIREHVALVPMASLPTNYLPHMTSKWSYYVQNSILSGKKPNSWMMRENSPLKAAGNCAGVHTHIELETAPEFLFSNRELMDKFNMGLMLTPMIAFSSSPYFYGKHEAVSMRGHRYYHGTYRNFPLNGQLPPVAHSSVDVLNNAQKSIEHWLRKAVTVGFPREEVKKLTDLKGANWNPVRWNRAWNTIEIRCLDSDSIELDCAKFLWACSAMKRMDLKGEALTCSPISTTRSLDQMMIRDCFSISGKEVSILPTQAINDLFERAVIFGTKDELVGDYLARLGEFARAGVSSEDEVIFTILQRALEKNRTTAEWMLTRTNGRPEIDNEFAADLIIESIERQSSIIKTLRTEVPEIFSQLEQMTPQI
jgi:hypothetical protein